MLIARMFSRGVVLLVCVQLLVAGCMALTGETAGENIDDAVITSEVKAKLAGEKLVNTTRVRVKTERGVVYLTGAVGTTEEGDQVIQITKNVKGVRKVVDHLEVRP